MDVVDVHLVGRTRLPGVRPGARSTSTSRDHLAGDEPGGTTERDPAERAVLVRLGETAELERRYAVARQYFIQYLVYLVEPDVYPVWVRVLRWPFPVFVTIAAVAGGIRYFSTTPEGERRSLTLTPPGIGHTWTGPGKAETRVDAVVLLVTLAVLAAVPFVPSTFLSIGHLNGGGPLVNPEIRTGWLAGYATLIGALAVVRVWRLVSPG